MPQNARVSCFCLTLALILYVSPATLAAACGMSTHAEVCTRAVHYLSAAEYPEFKQALLEHPEAYQAGSAFPDWGYAFGYPDASEEAHWPPFLDAFALNLLRGAPTPWDPETRRLIAFFLGVVSHDIADIDWHGLAGVRQGFIDVMSKQEFLGDWGQAHDCADTGGDMVESHERDMDWLAASWYFPLEDMARLYQLLGYGDITAEVLGPRTQMLFLGAVANKIGGAFLYGGYAGQSPFLVEEFQDYLIGGLDAMALRTTWWWEDYIGLMRGEGTRGPTPVPVGDRRACCPSPVPAAVEQGQRWWRDGVIEVEEERTPRGVLYKARVHPDRAGLSGGEARAEFGLEPEADLRFSLPDPYSYLGHSLAAADFNKDGISDLVMGAPGNARDGGPQQGAVLLFYGREGTAASPRDAREADLVVAGPEPFGRFGRALASGDFNADGCQDLAVGAPAAGAQTLRPYGRVFLYFGRCGEPGLSTEADVTIRGWADGCRLGWALAGGDVNGDGADDLVMGAPYAVGGGEQRGLAAVFFGGAWLESGTRLTLADVDWIQRGDDDYDWFGYSVGVCDRGPLGPLLLVGAPGVDAGSRQAVGALSAYDLRPGAVVRPVFTLLGEEQFDKTGQAFVTGRFYGDDRTLLALAAPTRAAGLFRQAGGVDVVELEGLSGLVPVQGLQGANGFVGNQEFARFGWRPASGDYNGDGIADLLITQPWLNSLSRGPMAGQALLWKGGPGFQPGGRTPESAALRLAGPRRQARFGDAALMADFNGDGYDDLVLAASRDSLDARHTGSVSVFWGKADSGACFIATAAMGDVSEGRLGVLRDFRDRQLLRTSWGRKLVQAYYRLSPPLAALLAEHEGGRRLVRVLLLPLVGFSTLWL